MVNHSFGGTEAELSERNGSQREDGGERGWSSVDRNVKEKCGHQLTVRNVVSRSVNGDEYNEPISQL